MPNEGNNRSNFWRNVATGVGIAAAGTALAYLMSEVLTEALDVPESHSDQRRGGDSLHPELRQLHPDQLREEITDRLNSGTYECSICLEDVSRDSYVWSCPNCYFIYHLSCIQGYFHSLKVSGESCKCPVCRTAIPINTPVNYSCFCGRKRLSQTVMRNEDNVGRTPHTCSGVCSKPMCHLRCHPGPCNSKASI